MTKKYHKKVKYSIDCILIDNTSSNPYEHTPEDAYINWPPKGNAAEIQEEVDKLDAFIRLRNIIDAKVEEDYSYDRHYRSSNWYVTGYVPMSEKERAAADGKAEREAKRRAAQKVKAEAARALKEEKEIEAAKALLKRKGLL